MHIVEDDITCAIVYLGRLRDLAIFEIVDGGDGDQNRPKESAPDDYKSNDKTAERDKFEPHGEPQKPSSSALHVLRIVAF